MYRIFGLLLSMFAITGLASSPALAGLFCAMQCENSQITSDQSSDVIASAATTADMGSELTDGSSFGAGAMSAHCAQMLAKSAKTASPEYHSDSQHDDFQEHSVDVQSGDIRLVDGKDNNTNSESENGCQCVAGCGLMAAAGSNDITTVSDANLTSGPVIFSLAWVADRSFAQPYRPPIA